MLKGDCNICVNGKTPPDFPTCVECGLARKNYKPRTRADRLRAMTDEELAKFMGELPCCPPGADVKELCYPMDSCEGTDLQVRCWLDWLKQEETI